MNDEKISKILAVLLSLVMMVSLLVPAFAENETQDIPIVYVRGQGGALYDADKKYISPDNIINASTGMFKDSTFFVKDLPHNINFASVDELINMISRSVQQFTVESNENYPQFMIYNPETGSVDSFENSSAPEKTEWSGNLFAQLFRFIRLVISYIRSLISAKA